MPRIRTIKPEFFTSIDIAALPMTARILFIGLWTHADDEGRGLNEPRLIKAALFPLDDDVTAGTVDDLMDALHNAGLVKLYEDDEKRALFQVTGWKKHQRIDKPRPSRYLSPTDPALVVDDSTTDQGTLLVGKERTGQDTSPLAVVISEYVLSVCLAQKNTGLRFRDAVHDNASRERGPILKAYIAAHPDYVLDDLRELLGLARVDGVPPAVVRTPEHDPDCEFCAGTGWATIDFDKNVVGRCDCRYDAGPKLRAVE